MTMKTAINLAKEYLNLVILQYSLAVMVWVLLIFTGSGYDWALFGAVGGSLMFAAAGWKKIFFDAAKGGCSGLYQGLPVTDGEQKPARMLAVATGILIILAGFIAMNAVMWKRIEFWDAQYVYNGTDYNKGRHYVEWLYQTFMMGGGGQ